jgi:oligosaccharide repeat unit polymerase
MRKPTKKASHSALFAGFALAGVALCDFAIGASSRQLQVVAGIVVLLLIAGWIVVDILVGRFHAANLRYFALFSFGLFLGGGMIVDAVRPDYAIQPAAILLTYGALLCFVLGFVLFEPNPVSAPCHSEPTFSLTSEQLFTLTCFFFALGFFFVFLEWHLYGQLQSYAGKFTAAGARPARVMPYVQTFTEFMTPAVILAFIQLRRGTSLARRVVLTLFLTGAVAWFLVWGARGNFLWLAVAFVLVWVEIGSERGARRLGAKPVLVLSLSAAAILPLGLVRTTWNLREAESAGWSGVWTGAGESLDTYYQLARTLDYFPARAGFLDGYSFYGVIANPVPRALWPGKPIGVGKLASLLYDGNPQNSIGLSLPGELYANFGYVGSLLGMFLFGLLAAAVYSWYMRQRGDPVALVIYLMALSCLVTEVRGDILDATAPLLYSLLPTVICFGIVATATKRFRPNAQKAPTRATSQSVISPLATTDGLPRNI